MKKRKVQPQTSISNLAAGAQVPLLFSDSSGRNSSNSGVVARKHEGGRGRRGDRTSRKRVVVVRVKMEIGRRKRGKRKGERRGSCCSY